MKFNEKNLFGIIPLLALFFAFLSCSTSAKKPQGKMLSFRYSEHGSMAQPNCDFTVTRIDDKTCTVRYFNHDKEIPDTIQNYDEEMMYDTLTFSISLLDEIQNVVMAHKMWKYKEHYSPMFDVLDGTSWSLSIRFDDDVSISSGGYHSWPKDKGLREVDDLLRPKCKGL